MSGASDAGADGGAPPDSCGAVAARAAFSGRDRPAPGGSAAPVSAAGPPPWPKRARAAWMLTPSRDHRPALMRRPGLGWAGSWIVEPWQPGVAWCGSTGIGSSAIGVLGFRALLHGSDYARVEWTHSLTSGDADGLRTSKPKHAVEGMNRNSDLGRATPIRSRA